MQAELERRMSRTLTQTLAALVSLEVLNLILWLALYHGSQVLAGNLRVDHGMMVVVGAYPILLLSPLLTKWYFRNCSLLPLYVLNLAQMGAVTWRVIN